jgi:hypothetical protein
MSARAPGAFTRETVQRYRAWLETQGLAPSSRNPHLTVIRKLAREARGVIVRCSRSWSAAASGAASWRI